MRANIIRGSSQTKPSYKGIQRTLEKIETKTQKNRRVEKYAFTHVDNKIVG